MNFFQAINKFGATIGGFVPDWLIGLSARVAIFMVFWPSAQTKITGGKLLGQNFAFWNVTETTFLLFENEYAVPILPSNISAYLATFGEFFFALFILLGIFTRLSAAGLLGITAVIQLFVYPDIWITHLIWAALLIYLLKNGAGAVSIDTAVIR
ncbi:MAG: DoxX family protein [Cellvibrionaceae bacterium]|nr:DoxX family protein [Cellvibrionaceae bacterium]